MITMTATSRRKNSTREAVTRLREEYNRLQRRIDAMYVDKLDGKVGERFFRSEVNGVA